MFQVENVSVDKAIADAKFCCDLSKCKGACCYLDGGRGAPIDDSEIKELEKVAPVVRRYLSERSLKIIDEDGLYEGRSGDFAIHCVDDKECIFVCFEDGIAKCAIEKAYLNGEVEWRKPISCHLFPIRVHSYGRTPFMRYVQIKECAFAVARGEKENVYVCEFLEEALIRKFGANWYRQFQKECKRGHIENSDTKHESVRSM
jgi:hypothetical protein